MVWLACGGGDERVSYSRDVQPLFERRCIECHHTQNSGLVDLEDPFTPDFDAPAPGLIGSRNVRANDHPSMPQYNLVPFNPEGSFVMQKVTDGELRPPDCDPVLEQCQSPPAGFFMPPVPRRLPGPKISAVKLWIALGARDDDLYRSQVRGIFSDPVDSNGSGCEDAGLQPGCIACVTCHYEGAPDAPDLTQPFDPIVGIVGVKSTFRVDLDLVVPFDPNASFLLDKLEAFFASSDVGAPMPYRYPPLNTHEVDVLRQWIIEGAPNN